MGGGEEGGRAGEPCIMVVKVPDDAVEGFCPPDFAPSLGVTEHKTTCSLVCICFCPCDFKLWPFTTSTS